MASYPLVVAVLVAGLALVKAAEIGRRAYFTSLRAVPGPWYAALTNLVLKYHVVVGDRTDYIHALHHQYGPYVRIAPDEIAVNDPAAAKEIHRVNSPYRKHDFYKTMGTGPKGGPIGIFGMIDSKQHSIRRKMLSRGFSKAVLREQWQDLVIDRVELAVSQIKRESEQHGSSDMYRWWMCMAADVSANVMFGDSFHTLESGEKAEYLKAIEAAIIGSAISAELYPIYAIGRILPFKSTRYLFHADEYLHIKGKEAWAATKSNPHTRNVFDTVVASSEKDEPTLTEQEAVIEAGNLILAGTDTTANTLTYMIYSVLADPFLQQSLVKELATVEEPLTDAKLETLPLLNAVMEETLRLYCAAPASEPRIVPAGGSTFSYFHFPAGTTVSVQPWSLHRRAELFPNPEVFDVGRWLDPARANDAVRNAMMPWGGGSRICLGMHLARMELRLATAVFFRKLGGAKLAGSTTKESMTVENRFLIAPVGHKCEIVA